MNATTRLNAGSLIKGSRILSYTGDVLTVRGVYTRGARVFLIMLDAITGADCKIVTSMNTPAVVIL